MKGSWVQRFDLENRLSNIEGNPLELPPLPTASPPKGGDETLVVKWESVLVPPLGGKVVRSTKRGMPSGKGDMLARSYEAEIEPMNLRTMNLSH